MSSFALMPLLAMLCVVATAMGDQWRPAEAPLMTRWAQDVSPEKVHPEYPRPQLVRDEWQNLNGLWEYALTARDAGPPENWDGEILVPFPIESALSGVGRRIDETRRLWYRRTFAVPAAWQGQRVLLHFGAVDWEATVWVNGRELGTHRGGYDPFTFDITDALRAGEQTLTVAVFDPTDAGTQPRGKQVCKPGSIWYTPASGIWQTVWLEPVPPTSLRGLRITPDLDAKCVHIEGDVEPQAKNVELDVVVSAAGKQVAQASGSGKLKIVLPEPRLWSPADPFLYDLAVTLKVDGKPVDAVTSYFGMRKISCGHDDNGVLRLMLNNEPLFMYGPLDQGYWPDGLYTAPTDEALRYDLELTRDLGFNMTRKHVKIEPARWYYWCDRLGLLVWQDMPSGDGYAEEGKQEIERSPESARQYEVELKRMIDTFYNHPCIVVWVPFNEGWGQFDTARIVKLVKQQDPTRLVDAASGWHDMHVGDIVDLHAYPMPISPQPEADRVAVLGEFGGLGLRVEGHLWRPEQSWGYQTYETPQALTDAYLGLMQNLRGLVRQPGLSAAVYTQITDVEIETNGLATYDRAVLKVDADRVKAAHQRLYDPRPRVTPVVPTSQEQGHTWRYTTEQPADDWFAPDFDDSAWPTGAAGFGVDGTPGAVVRTTWNTADIWLRRTVDIKELPSNPEFQVYHDEACEIYVNGALAGRTGGYSTSYVLVPWDGPAALRVGENVIAVHCHQTRGGQGIDVGIVNVEEARD